MANKTLGTRQKLTFRIEPSTRAGTARPRNILVPLARGRKAGAHTDGDHAERQRGHADVRRALRTMNEDDKE
ncbi:hypothetical protein ACI2S3_14580 [Ralstonia nicotianae]|uniref:hypothetical protein n=1 Tax=Ralstonia pseudosolanacearum TaxID=1310165 RepID=UPI0008DA12AC|nr:hypothetical protein [Ralstonia pseudosolanacearum]OHV01045.1 hypothetical protein BLA34_09760 [Ralstonia solanacearum]